MAELFCFREWILNSMNICWACFSALKNVLVPSVSNWNGIKSGISLNEVLLLHQNLFWALAPHSALQINNLAAISSNDYVLGYTYIWRSQELWYKSRSFLKMTQGFSEVITESYLLRQLLLSWCPLLNPWKKSYDQPRQHIQKQRHYLADKVRLVKAMVFPAVMYGCESWTIRKAEHPKLMLLNCGVGEDSWESLGLQRDQSSQP